MTDHSSPNIPPAKEPGPSVYEYLKAHPFYSLDSDPHKLTREWVWYRIEYALQQLLGGCGALNDFMDNAMEDAYTKNYITYVESISYQRAQVKTLHSLLEQASAHATEERRETT